jgi:hypothetical protein
MAQQTPFGPPMPAPFADEVTRLLCATAHLHPAFADALLAVTDDYPYVAIAPPYGVDVLALVRHAARVHRRRLRRRLLHAGLLLLGLVLLYAVFRWSSAPLLHAAMVVVLAGLLAWALALGELLQARGDALTLIETSRKPLDMAPPVGPDLERRLAELDRMNVVVWRTDLLYPFVGSGSWISSWSIPALDITRPATDQQGQPRQVIAFDAVGLHDHIARTVRARNLAGLNVRNRLYVRGATAQHVPGLIESPLRPPARIVSSAVVKSALLQDQSTIQTYLCLERIVFGGQLGVSMFVRAMVEENLLTVRADSFFLPPLNSGFRSVTRLPRERWRVTAKAALDAAFAAPGNLLTSPLELAGDLFRRLGRRRRLARLGRRVRRGRGFDYGAVTSIRHAVSDLAQANHVHQTSEEGYLRRLQHHVLNATVQFLEDHNVDTSELRRQQDRIINSTTYHFGNVNGQGIYIGPNGQVVNNFPSAQPRGGGPGDGGP